MLNDIRLHGHLAGTIEYYVLIAGDAPHNRFLCHIDQSENGPLRLFSPGNEFVIGPEGIVHLGNGGFFCEYMFGIDQPLPDLAKVDVINRLVMFGTRTDRESDVLAFSDQTNGSLSYEKIFFNGHALSNYFFFVHSPRLGRSTRRQQEELLRLLGKTIKRSCNVGRGVDDLLAAELFPLLKDPQALIFLIRLVNRPFLQYGALFQELYFRSKRIADDDFARLSALAVTHGIDRYQQERIRIDVMYRHPDNQRIVDEYRNILIACDGKGEISDLEHARLTRLKTLSVRNKIPGALFFTLDEMLRKDQRMSAREEGDYLSETRQILQGLFLCDRPLDNSINRDDMLKLLFAKKTATASRHHTFLEILLDAGRACDEQIRDGADISLQEQFSMIVTYFDRYDTTAAFINQLAYMECVRITEEMLQTLVANRREFNLLQAGLFCELFIDDILHDRYLGRFGRSKIITVQRGLQQIEEGTLLVRDLLAELLVIDGEERLFALLLGQFRERIRNFYPRDLDREELAALRRDVVEELSNRRQIAWEIPDAIFREALLTVKKEAVYLHNLLPQIVATNDLPLREDFLENSGLDRFSIEELEHEFYERNGLRLEELYQLRKGLAE